MSNARWFSVGLILFAFAALLLNSCRSLPVSPASGLTTTVTTPQPESPPAGPEFFEAEQVPGLARFHSSVRGGTLFLSGMMKVSGTTETSYDPDHAGGWMLQLFLNTDRARTGYPWTGADYVVRGGERSPDGRSLVVRRIEAGYGGPGGWGPQSGVARLTLRGQRFVIAVPLAAIGDDDGGLDFVLETYATVSCAECESGVSHRRVADYAGATRILRDAGPIVATGTERGHLIARASGRPGSLPTGSDTDAHW